MSPKTQSPSFEEAMEKLEGIVNSLERGELSLEDSMNAFEEGSKLVGLCEEKLNKAQMRIEKITASAGAVAVEKNEKE